jgi:ATP-binding cassette subfamily F protein 3
VYTREALEAALEKFTGALIVVSHDRYFVDRVAENIILVEDGAAEVYSGNYSDLVEKMKTGAAVPKAIAPPDRGALPPPAAHSVTSQKSTAEGGGAPQKQHIDRNELRKREKRVKKIEEELAQLEGRIASAEGERERNDVLLCAEEVFRDGDRVKKIHTQNADLKAMIDLLYGKWELLAKEKESLEAELSAVAQ